MYSIFFIISIILVLVHIYQKKNNAKCKSTKQLNGKTVIVTGGTLGIGVRIALNFARRGARVIIACPYEKEGTNARRVIIQKTENRNVIYKCLDLANLESVRNFAKDILKNEDRLDILVNNAGVGVVGDFLTEDGMNFIMQVNYYGHFLLTLLLLPLLSKTGTESEKSRIINATSMLRAQGSLDVENYNRVGYWYQLSIYSNSKLSVVLFSKALTRRLRNHNIVINNADPGLVATRIYESYNIVVGYILKYLLFAFFKNPWEGAQTAIHVALDDDAGIVSGQVFENCKMTDKAWTFPWRESKNMDQAAEKLWDQSVKLVKLENSELGILKL
ncbi:unnamed protein product, partial [Brenthis ino]